MSARSHLHHIVPLSPPDDELAQLLNDPEAREIINKYQKALIKRRASAGGRGRAAIPAAKLTPEERQAIASRGGQTAAKKDTRKKIKKDE